MKEPLKIIYEFVRFFIISIPVFCVVCIVGALIVIFKQAYSKLKFLFKTFQ
jgi:hypothetical protein